ncbi:Uma2 family endonuclease [Virgibacillus oceani]
MPFPEKKQPFTYADYLSWPEDVRAEIIDGSLYMKAAPSIIHQKISIELSRQIANYLVGKDCEVYPAPFHVVLNFDDENKREEDNRDVVEPDISIICDSSLLDDAGCKGTPDMIIKIITPSTGRKDKLEKFNKYEQAGLSEYWIVEPQEKMVSVFTLQKNMRYGRPDLHSSEDRVKVSIFDDLFIELDKVFDY